MAISNYPSGFRGGALIKNAPLYDMIDGNIYWVDSGTGGAGGTGAFTNPTATIQQGIDLCTANNNDVVFVRANHAETISDATELTPNVAGVSIIGLGRGTGRPTITFDNASSSIAVSAADVTMQNFVWHSTAADVADAVTPTAKRLVLKDIVLTNSGAGQNWVDLVDLSTTDNQADGLTLQRIRWKDIDTSTYSMVNVDANIDRLSILDCYVDLGINGVVSTFIMCDAGSSTTNLLIQGNYKSRLEADNSLQVGTFADTATAKTGLLKWNDCRSLDTAGELFLTATSNVHSDENYTTSVIDKSGYASVPAVDS